MKKIVLLFFIATLTVNCYCQKKEELAIKKLLEKESATWRTGDVKAHADCWAIKPYSKIVVSTLEGNVIDVPPDVILNPPAEMVGQGGFSTNSNYKMHISGKNAWVSHNEESTAQNGTKNFTYEFRILEKIQGKWKLVGQSIHAYKPK
jgi:hypothetical protein